ncbi:MAG TPA: hypothetical protein VMH00_15695 [Candidatus Limnocylindrales bacterium]|nr:hypothetical protein [Candidatus Limnocylindrales bacterium]
MHQFKYAVRTKCGRRQAWEVYTNVENWRSFANIYGEMQWGQGNPWEVGSRLDIQILYPVEVVIDHTIILCEPRRGLGWIDRALGVTISQWVMFDDDPGGGTRVVTEGEVFSHGIKIAGKPVEYLVEIFTETWYENFRAACDQSFEANSCPTMV